MKTNCKFILLALLVGTAMAANYSYAQDPTLEALVQEEIIGSPPPSENQCSPPVLRVKNTGNDIVDFSGSRYEVTVWDDDRGTNAGLGWRVTQGTNIYQCWSPFWKSRYGLFAQDPDVCIVTNSNTGEVYAIAVYYADTDPNPINDHLQYGLYIMEVWQWDNTNKEFVVVIPPSGDFYPNRLYIGGPLRAPYGSALNIDGNTDGNFVITWDNQDKIYALAGSTPGPSTAPYPGLGNDQWEFIDHGYMPDVALNCVNPANLWAYFSFVDASNPNDKLVAVDREDLSSIAALSSNATREHSQQVDQHGTSCNAVIEYPRIACPPLGSPLPSEQSFHVVYLEKPRCMDPLYRIHGLNRSTAGIKDWLYNDGSFGGAIFNIIRVPNTRPVTTYDNSGELLWVGWEFDNISGYYPIGTQTGITQSMYPLAIQCDLDGRWNTGCCPRYMEVPKNAIPGVISHSLSIAGRHTVSLSLPPKGDNLYSFFEDGAYIPTVYTKVVPQGIPCPTQLKLDETNLNQTNGFQGIFNSLLLPDGADANTYTLLLSVHDISGKLLVRDEGNIYQLERNYNSLSRQLSPGIYIAGLHSADGKINLNSKVFIAGTY